MLQANAAELQREVHQCPDPATSADSIAPAGTGRIAAMLHRFKAAVARVEQEQQSGVAAPVEEGTGWQERLRRRSLCWIAEKVAEHIAKGEAELGIHQISEILPVKGIVLVGPLPAEIQNYTVYAAGLGANAKEADAAKALLKALSGPAAAEVLKAKGMEPAGS
jgi:hypothetical protein